MSEESIEKLLPHRWPQAEAEVTDCTFAKFQVVPDGVVGFEDDLAHYAVGFTYTVDGTTYSGELSSPVKVEPHDKFMIRYNPRHHEQNNSPESELDRPWFRDYTYLVAAVIFGALAYGLLQRYIFHHG